MRDKNKEVEEDTDPWDLLFGSDRAQTPIPNNSLKDHRFLPVGTIFLSQFHTVLFLCQ
jgi:hypothetical protein